MPRDPWQITIKKDSKSKRWVVGKPTGRPHRGVDLVEWTLDPDPDGHDVSAHFQFASLHLFANREKGRNDLTDDMTAKIETAGGKLTLLVHPEAKNGKDDNPHYYAVWIRDEMHPKGGEYAVGPNLNPPPEIDVGP